MSDTSMPHGVRVSGDAVGGWIVEVTRDGRHETYSPVAPDALDAAAKAVAMFEASAPAVAPTSSMEARIAALEVRLNAMAHSAFTTTLAGVKDMLARLHDRIARIEGAPEADMPPPMASSDPTKPPPILPGMPVMPMPSDPPAIADDGTDTTQAANSNQSS